tara:strand:- start:21604 stop:21858 length:255 start_codon:yes stop_codon:yes gene_type:complete
MAVSCPRTDIIPNQKSQQVQPNKHGYDGRLVVEYGRRFFARYFSDGFRSAEGYLGVNFEAATVVITLVFHGQLLEDCTILGLLS